MTHVRATGSMAVLATRNISDSPFVLVHQRRKVITTPSGLENLYSTK